MARSDALQHVLGECVYTPAGVLTERASLAKQQAEDFINNNDNNGVAGDGQPQPKTNGGLTDDEEEDETTRCQPRWRAVESRVSALETQMDQSAHALAKTRRETLLSLHDRLVYDILPRLWKERTAAAARERVLMERVDQLAGTWVAARSLHERARRQVSITMTEEFLSSSKTDYHVRQDVLTQALEDIRAQLQAEQDERQRQDEVIRTKMIGMTTALRNAMLEAVGDPED